MKLKNQTNKEIIKEYMEKVHDVYNAMQQVMRSNPYTNTVKFTRALLKLTTLISLYKSLEKGDNYDPRN
jgi:hypothetical protein